MKLPITIDEHGDINVFNSVEEAELYMEPIDVEHGEYVVRDADGRQLIVNIVIEEVPLLGGLFRGRVKKVRIAHNSQDATR